MKNDDARRHALTLIESKLELVYQILSECEEIAKEGDVAFSFYPPTGQSGRYDPGEEVWMSSSSNC